MKFIYAASLIFINNKKKHLSLDNPDMNITKIL